ncbi:MAG TPA: sulfatase-like hydrolase/transferase, partial [Myxococcota bacterium]|nr:sulfatase-like hydrolase/transferase [Myxococcota bacterium]
FAMINLLESHVPYHQLADSTVFLPEPTRQCQAAAAGKRYNEFLELDPAGSPPTAEELPLLLALHDAGVYADDVQLAALVALLERRGRSRDTLLLITSDHGELFGEAGLWEHHVSLEDAVLRVPLVLRFPGKVPAGRSIPQAVSGVDLLPTVLELLGLARLRPAGVQGRSLLPLLSGEGGEVPIFAESQPGEGEMLRRRAVAWGLPTTPMRREIRGKELILEPFSPDPSARPAKELDPATRARLEALGYQEGE